MGLCTVDIVRIIKIIKSRNVKSLCMIGRQNINTTWDIFIPIMEKFGWEYNKVVFEKIKGTLPIDTYKFFEMFGLKEVHAIDYTENDGADILFDLNDDLPDRLRAKYEMVLNGGTLEHVFDVAKAMKNISDIVSEGGIIVHTLPLAGYVEHGFYSFSPTFFTDFYELNKWNIVDLNLEFRMTKGILQPEWTIVYSQDCRLFQTYKNAEGWEKEQNRLNDYIMKIFKVETMGNIMIWCIAERKEQNTFIYPIQKVYEVGNGQEIEKSKRNIKNVDFQKAIEIIGNNRNKKISLFGAGYICNKLIDFLHYNDMENNIQCIFDSDIRIAGNSMRGYRIVYPTQKKINDMDIIIVCTNKFEEEVVNFLKENNVQDNKIKTITVS